MVERALIQPGYTSPPAASITCAPCGTATPAPTSVIRPFRITMVPRSMTGRVIGTILAFVMASAPDGPGRVAGNAATAAGCGAALSPFEPLVPTEVRSSPVVGFAPDSD